MARCDRGVPGDDPAEDGKGARQGMRRGRRVEATRPTQRLAQILLVEPDVKGADGDEVLQ